MEKSKREHIAFVTGRLAESGLREILEGVSREHGFDYTVTVLEISVAALMTAPWVARRLEVAPGVDRILLPGYCKGDLEPVRAAAGGIPVARGPRDFRRLPLWFESGGEADAVTAPPGYGKYRIEIVAEINNAPQLSPAEIKRIARSYLASGADVIDVGCDPGSTWEGVGDCVRRLREEEGCRVAVDTFGTREMELAARAGAELVLSVNTTSVAVARDLGCEVVAIPDDPKTLAGLEATLEKLAEWKVPHRADPIVEPIGVGFAASLGRYIELRKRYPDLPILMGIGNITELTDVDSAGVNTLLVGFCEELGIESVLTTEVIPWARNSVREIDIARKLMHYAVAHGVLPKHLTTDLVILGDSEVNEHGEEFLSALAANIRDRNYRIFAEAGLLHVMNRDCHLKGSDPFDLFDALDVKDPYHAFYLGYEMAKAGTALQLRKEYQQDRELRWGFLTVEEKSHLERRRDRDSHADSTESAEDTPGKGEAPP